ncbi:hypothetical protein GQR58_026419 [Nymphon striatum]|nr:hypothetical protein GQR58_026419 [Nymphon striatum]
MSEETDSTSKQEKVDVNWGKAVDQMKSKLAQEDDPEVRQKILNATLDDVTIGGTNLWGRKSKIKARQAELDAAQKTREGADMKAKAMFQERIETADIQTLLNELSYKSQAAVGRLKTREVEIKEVEEKLKIAIVEAKEISDKQSSAYSEAIGKVTTIEQKVEELEGLKNAYTTLAASKDSFVHKHNLTIKVLTSLRSNLQTHRAKLKSDTDERLKYYDGYVHRCIQQVRKARQDMMDNIPVHEKVMQGVYSSYAEALQEIRVKDADIQKDFANRLWYRYERDFRRSIMLTDGNAPSSDGDDDTPAPPAPTVEDDLLNSAVLETKEQYKVYFKIVNHAFSELVNSIANENICTDAETTFIKHEIYDILDATADRNMDVDMMAYAIDKKLAYVIPKRVKKIDLGPLHSVFAKDEMEYMSHPEIITSDEEVTNFTVVFFEALISEIQQRLSTFEYTETVTDRTYKLEKSEFAISGWDNAFEGTGKKY